MQAWHGGPSTSLLPFARSGSCASLRMTNLVRSSQRIHPLLARQDVTHALVVRVMRANEALGVGANALALRRSRQVVLDALDARVDIGVPRAVHAVEQHAVD